MLAAYSTSKSARWSLTNALRHELAAQKTQVLGLYMAYVDTDLTRGFDVQKSSAEEIVQRATAAIGDGAAMSGCIDGEGVWLARRKFTQTQIRPKIAKTKSAYQTASEHGLQGLRLKFASLGAGVRLHARW